MEVSSEAKAVGVIFFLACTLVSRGAVFFAHHLGPAGCVRWRKVVDLVVEVVPHAPDGAGIGVDGLGLQALEFEVFEVAAVRATKGLRKRTRVEPAGMGEHGQTPGKLRSTCITTDTCAYSLRIHLLRTHSA